MPTFEKALKGEAPSTAGMVRLAKDLTAGRTAKRKAEAPAPIAERGPGFDDPRIVVLGRFSRAVERLRGEYDADGFWNQIAEMGKQAYLLSMSIRHSIIEEQEANSACG